MNPHNAPPCGAFFAMVVVMISLSFSQLTTYQRCPRQYEFAYKQKLPWKMSYGESFGVAVHNLAAAWGKLELEQAQPKKDTQSLQMGMFGQEPQNAEPEHTFTEAQMIELWHASFPIDAFGSKADADRARERGDVVVRQFFRWWAGKERVVVGVEKGFRLEEYEETEEAEEPEEGRSILTGRIDRIEKTDRGFHIIDFKTGALRTQEDVDEDLQLSVYALACRQMFGELPARLSLVFLGEDGVTEITTTRTEDQLNEALAEIRRVEDGISVGDFHAIPSVSKCSRCPYRNICDAAAV